MLDAGELGMAWVVLFDGLCGVQPSRSACEGFARGTGRGQAGALVAQSLSSFDNERPEASLFAYVIRYL